jgi:hypothetical protein
MAPMLLHHRKGGIVQEIPNSRSRDLTHCKFIATLAMALYFAYIKDRATMHYILYF